MLRFFASDSHTDISKELRATVAQAAQAFGKFRVSCSQCSRSLLHHCDRLDIVTVMNGLFNHFPKLRQC